MESLSTTCLIAGGGPAGMMAGYLLARAGIDVIVLEKHKDFLRDFRGDTIHPSTLEVMFELGLLERFLARPHQEVRHLKADIGKQSFVAGDFARLPTHCKFLAFMPQWDFLDFIAEEAKRYPSFRLIMEGEVSELLARGNRICGVVAKLREGARAIEAALVIGADGRHSTLRSKAGFSVKNLGAAFDVVWLRLPAELGDPKEPTLRFQAGQLFIMLWRHDYWQCAMVIPKGEFETVKSEGITGFRARLRNVSGFARDRVEAIQSFADVSLLTVRIDRMTRWSRPGLLLIGDAAHAMSPVGGVGINLAIQDAVAASNILAPILRERAPSSDELMKVQRRREWPTLVTQWFQLQVQSRVIAPSFRRQTTPRPPLVLHLLNAWPWLRQFPARFIGLGVRPEHVRTQAQAARSPVTPADNAAI